MRSFISIILAIGFLAVAGACRTMKLIREPPVARLIVMAHPVEFTRIPSPDSIAPYRRAMVVNRYEVDKIVEGRYDEKQIMVAHWVIRDGRMLPGAARDKTKIYRMVLEPFNSHPEFESERLVVDMEEYRLPLYYETK